MALAAGVLDAPVVVVRVVCGTDGLDNTAVGSSVLLCRTQSACQTAIHRRCSCARARTQPAFALVAYFVGHGRILGSESAFCFCSDGFCFGFYSGSCFFFCSVATDSYSYSCFCVAAVYVGPCSDPCCCCCCDLHSCACFCFCSSSDSGFVLRR